MNTQYNDMDTTSKVSFAKMEKTFIFSRVLLIKVHLKSQIFGKGSLNFTIIILPLKTISVTTSHIPSTTAEVPHWACKAFGRKSPSTPCDKRNHQPLNAIWWMQRLIQAPADLSSWKHRKCITRKQMALLSLNGWETGFAKQGRTSTGEDKGNPVQRAGKTKACAYALLSQHTAPSYCTSLHNLRWTSYMYQAGGMQGGKTNVPWTLSLWQAWF